MNVVLSYVITALVGFLAGWFGRDWWVGSKTRKKVAKMDKPALTARSLGYWVMFAVIVAGIIYSNANTKSQVSASEQRQITETRRQIACLSMTFQDFLSGNQELRDASQKRDQALVDSKTALRELVYLRVIKGVPDNAAVQAAAQQYMTATQAFIEASEALDKARARYTLPDFEARCGKLEPGFKGAWFSDIEGFDAAQQPTGLSIEAP